MFVHVLCVIESGFLILFYFMLCVCVSIQATGLNQFFTWTVKFRISVIKCNIC